MTGPPGFAPGGWLFSVYTPRLYRLEMFTVRTGSSLASPSSIAFCTLAMSALETRVNSPGKFPAGFAAAAPCCWAFCAGACATVWLTIMSANRSAVTLQIDFLDISVPSEEVAICVQLGSSNLVMVSMLRSGWQLQDAEFIYSISGTPLIVDHSVTLVAWHVLSSQWLYALCKAP